MTNSSGDTAAIELRGQDVQEAALREQPARGERTPESLADLFAPDIVLPEQFFEGARRDSQASGEKALMLAVLETASAASRSTSGIRARTRLLSQQAEAWIRAVDYDWPFSFVNVCDDGIDPAALRAALLDWKSRRLAECSDRSPTPAAKKVYRLHLRTKRTSGLR
jgi:hypothetical protein